jgi:serine/threonine-protein kinase
MRLSCSTMVAVASSAAALLLAACSGGGSQSSALPGSPQTTAALTVTRPAPASKKGNSCPAARVYVANFGYGEILMYGTNWVTNPAPCGRIASGVFAPAAISLDRSGALYVSDFSLGAITVFKRGALTPSRTLFTAHAPWFVYAGADGTVYSSENGGGQVEVFALGATTVTRTITVPGPWGIATDRFNNLYVVSVDPLAGTRILKYAPGATVGVDIGISLTQQGSVGLLITKNGTLIAGSAGIQVFAPGATTPTRSFGSLGAYQMTLNADETRMYVASNINSIYEYDFATGSLLATITNGLSDPDGVAYTSGGPGR